MYVEHIHRMRERRRRRKWQKKTVKREQEEQREAKSQQQHKMENKAAVPESAANCIQYMYYIHPELP